MHERFRIHHGIGSRVLLDSDRDGVHFSYEREPAGWVFTVDTEKTPRVEEVLRLKDEINVFIFKEENGTAIEKVWYYTGNGSVDYDDREGRLQICASSDIAYKPGDFES